jgi:phenol hydroxylase P0 protein
MATRDVGDTRAALKKFVRVTGTRLDRYVEFEFSVNDPDLTVELILPFSAFDEFCALQEAVVLPSESAAVSDLERLAWRSRQPGLLRRVRSVADPDEPTRQPSSGRN